MNKKRILFMGTPEFAAIVLKQLLDNDYQIIAVVTQPDQKIGRKQILTYTPVKEVALNNNIPVYQPFKIRNEYEDLLALKPDLIITCAYGQIIPKQLLNLPPYHCINTHASLLPKGRGGAPIQRSLINGDEKTGVTLMFMNEKMDEGAILKQKEYLIKDEDTNSSLFNKLAYLASEMLLEFLPDYFEGKYNAIEQDSSQATYCYNLSKEDEFIHFDLDTRTVFNHIRGLLDEPGAYSILDGKSYKWIRVSYEISGKKEDDSLFVGMEKDYLRINCLDGFIKVYELKPEGKKTMDAKSFYNGNGRNLCGKYFRKELNYGQE